MMGLLYCHGYIIHLYMYIHTYRSCSNVYITCFRLLFFLFACSMLSTYYLPRYLPTY